MPHWTDWLDPEVAGLFLSAFISATLAPGGSEVLLAYLVAERRIPVASLFLAATVGNTLGGASTYLLGVAVALGVVGAERLLSRHHARALAWLQRIGPWALLLSWLPVVGDPLCLAAGWLRLPVAPSLLAILLGKAARYALICWTWG
jgi:membrane protein YqaA with SNARE-associated domain